MFMIFLADETKQLNTSATISNSVDKSFKNVNGLKAHKSKVHKALPGASSEDDLEGAGGQGEGSTSIASSSFPSACATSSADSCVSTAAA